MVLVMVPSSCGIEMALNKGDFLMRLNPWILWAMTMSSCMAVTWGQTEQTTSAPAEDGSIRVVVRADREGALTLFTPEASQAALRQVPGGTNLIRAEDYQRGRASNLRDALDFQPGVFVQERFGAEEARLSIRGSGIQRTFHGRGIRILQDGFTLNEADGGFDMQALDPLVYSHVEVWRGANALRFGGSTLGGAINFVSPTGHTANRLRIRGEAGSFDSWRGLISSGEVLGDFDYYAALTHSSSDGFRDYSQQNNQRVFANIGWRPYASLESRMFFQYAQSDSELPGNLTKQGMELNRANAGAGNVLRGDKRDFVTYRVGNRTTWRQDEQQIDASVSWAHKDLDHPIFNVLTPFFATGPGVIDLNTNNFSGELRYTNESDWFGRGNRFTFGILPSASIGEDTRFENLNNTSARGRKFADGTEEVFNFEAYLENDHYLTDQLALTLGTQFTYARRRYDDTWQIDNQNGAANDVSTDQDYYGISPKIGLRYEFDPEISAFLNLSRSFEPPSMGEIKIFRASAAPPPLFPNRLPRLASQDLKAQSATTVEVGTRGKRSIFAWDLVFYHAWVDRELLALNDAGGNPLGTINATATRHYGIELGLSTRLWEGILAHGGESSEADQIVLRQVYHWSRFQFDSDPIYGSNQLGGIPEHHYRAELMYEHPSGFYIGPNVEWSIVKTPVDHANTWFADPYAILGLRTGYQSKKGFSVFFEARNLTDKVYAATTGVVADANGADTAQFAPGTPQAFYGGIEWKW